VVSVEITSREIFDQLQNLNVNVAVLAEKVDRLGPDHEERIRSLERSRWPLGTIAVIVPVLVFAYAFFSDLGFIG
jgi:hypothetical protein